MKLRLRSMDALGGVAETHRVQLPDTAALSAVKDFLAAKLSTAQPVPAESIRLSLNRSQELLSPDPSATLAALGLTSGDLVYFTLSAELSQPPPPQILPRNPNLDAVSTGQIAAGSKSAGEAGGSSSVPQALHVEPVHSSLPRTLQVEPMAYDLPDVVMAEAVHETKRSSSFVIGALKRELEAENASGAEGTVIHRLVMALQAALVDAGFLPLESCLGLLKDWASGASPTLTVKYTLLDLVAMLPEQGKTVVLNYSLMPNFVVVYGCVPGAQPSEVRRLCLELPKLAPLLYLDSNNAVGKTEEDEILELWKVLKDELCRPLMISLCELNGLSPPPCLMALPGDLIAKVLDFVPGEDLAKVECTCKELKGLAADNGLWKRKYYSELNAPGEGSRWDRNWKQWFGIAWTHKVANQKRQQQQQQQNKRLRPSYVEGYYGWINTPPSAFGFPLNADDYGGYGWTNAPPPPPSIFSFPLNADDYGGYGWTNFPPPPSPPNYQVNVDNLDQLISDHPNYSWP